MAVKEFNFENRSMFGKDAHKSCRLNFWRTLYSRHNRSDWDLLQYRSTVAQPHGSCWIYKEGVLLL